MSFLDQKEEVIDLILTRKGRELLAKGRFKPDSYSFFDEEVVYDNSHGSLNEGQNEIVNRIKEMLVSKNQTDWEEVTGQPKEKDKNLLLPIGKSSPLDESKPAWDVAISEGKITGSVKYIPLEYSGSVRENTNEHIPQLDVICEYNLYDYENKLWLLQSSDDLLIDIAEKNSTDTQDNFEIEFFEYLYDGEEKIVGLEKKYFSDKDFSESVVEYYFNFFFDEDADNPIKLKHVDIDGDLKKEEDDCKIDPRSCASEKIRQLREELDKRECEKDSDCSSGRCKQGKCVSSVQENTFQPKEIGQECVQNSECKGVKEGKAECKNNICTKVDSSNLKPLGSVGNQGKCNADAECGSIDFDTGQPCDPKDSNCFKMECIEGICQLAKG